MVATLFLCLDCCFFTNLESLKLLWYRKRINSQRTKMFKLCFINNDDRMCLELNDTNFQHKKDSDTINSTTVLRKAD